MTALKDGLVFPMSGHEDEDILQCSFVRLLDLPTTLADQDLLESIGLPRPDPLSLAEVILSQHILGYFETVEEVSRAHTERPLTRHRSGQAFLIFANVGPR